MIARYLRAAYPALLASVLLVGCATAPVSTPSAPDGSLVGLGAPVASGNLVITPLAVVEDSRCPTGVECIWAGRVVVTTLIEGSRWDDTADMVLGEPYATHGVSVVLVAARPEQRAGVELQPSDYRFIYTGG